ncbi:MAG: amidohydrolase family protein [Gemmatimonadota bacterium]|nr:amidohydrolase family protein [Gemmatimonadota bacterium]
MSGPPIRNGAIVVEGSRIVFVGTQSSAPAADGFFHAPDAIIMPGLVNAHSHLELTALRGLLEGLNFREWLRILTEVRHTVLDEQALLDSSTIGIHEGLLNGITTFADTTATGVPHAAMLETGVRGIAYVEVFGPSPETRDSAMAGLRAAVNSRRAHDTALVQTGVSPHAPYTVSQNLFTAVAEYAASEGLPVAVHVAESLAEVAFVRDGTGPFAEGLQSRDIVVTGTDKSPIAYLAATGLLDASPVLIHCVQADAADIAVIAEHNCSIVHCPVSNAKLGHGIAPLDRFLAAGIRTGLGSDSVASNNRMDLLTEARTAVLLQSIRQQTPDAMNATEALKLATLGGARALGIDSLVGTLEVGKQADIAIFPYGTRLEAVTSFDACDMLVHALAGALTASTVLVAGVERVRNGAVLHDDIELSARRRQLGARLQGWRKPQ